MQRMPSIDSESTGLTIPRDAHTLAGFRAWQESADFPERGRIEFCEGQVLIDMSSERLWTHTLIKGAIYRAIDQLVEERNLGMTFADGIGFTSDIADIATEPDGLFVSWETIRGGRAAGVREEENALAIRGVADWILEVVSPSSVHKDKKRWRRKYAEAGVAEYWIVDARNKDIEFDLLVLERGEHQPRPEVDGWRASAVFDVEVRLVRRELEEGFARYVLETR